jgi:hypothetical protein
LVGDAPLVAGTAIIDGTGAVVEVSFTGVLSRTATAVVARYAVMPTAPGPLGSLLGERVGPTREGMVETALLGRPARSPAPR